MKINIISENNIVNGKIVAKNRLEELLEQDNTKIYEVIRVIDNKPIFLKEHFERMMRSIELSRLNGEIDYINFKEYVEMLIIENSFLNCNIRVSFIKDEPIFLMYFVKSSYPADDLYNNGIKVVLVKKHRKDPNIKFFESSLRESIDKTLFEKNAFEALMVNDDDTISEGSKSNVFFVKGDKIITSNDSSVLLGVTRQKVVELCNANGINVEKRDISVSELKTFDAAFITGTSVDVLPIKKIDEILYDSAKNEIVNKTLNLYLEEVNKNKYSYK